MIRLITVIFISLLSCFHSIASNDTLIINSIRVANFEQYFFLYEDSHHILTIDSLLAPSSNYIFNRVKDVKINFGLSNSNHWLKVYLQNNLGKAQNFILEMKNPDIDFVSFYLIKNDTIIKVIETGEIKDISTRDIRNRNFLFNIKLDPAIVYEVFIMVNNQGHSSSIPLGLKESSVFHEDDSKIENLIWLLYGLIFFIVLFNFYLYWTTRDKVNLYYALYVLSAFMIFFAKDGYLYIFNPPAIAEKFKYIYPSLYNVFMLLFTQAFISNNTKFRKLNPSLNVLKVITLFTGFLYFLNSPISSIVDVVMIILILITILIVLLLASLNFNRRYSPSILFLLAYISMFCGIIIYELKEANILNSNLFIESSILIGLSIECTLLTIAVLERFRINQNKAKQTILSNYKRIEYQNKELEFINTELEKLSLVASETDNSIAIFDTNGVLEWCNLGFERYYDTSQAALMEEKEDNIRYIIPDNNIEKHITQCIEKKQHSIFETLIKTIRQKEIWLQITLTPFFKDGKAKKLIAIGSDITGLKKYEKELTKALIKAEESDQLKSAFLANMSHEVRTPLNGIIGFSDLLATPNLSDEKKMKYIQTIQANGHQLIHIIDDIVEISLIEANQLKLSQTSFSLKGIINETVDFFETYKTTVQKEHITITTKIGHDSKFDILYADPYRINQILNNLFKNALKFSNSGNVHLATEIVDDFIQVSVEDEGIGIGEESREEIFEMFRQKEVTLNRQYGGTGLGLSISKGIVELLGGNIWLDVTYTKGARFCFTIPLSLVANAKEKDESTKHPTSKIY
jgi:PAS domain S-box-containing protein